MSTGTKVRMLHAEWDDTAVQAEVAAIIAETGAAMDPVGCFLSTHASNKTASEPRTPRVQP